MYICMCVYFSMACAARTSESFARGGRYASASPPPPRDVRGGLMCGRRKHDWRCTPCSRWSLHVGLYECMCACMRVCVYLLYAWRVCMYVCMYICMYVCMCACMLYACMCVCVYLNR